MVELLEVAPVDDWKDEDIGSVLRTGRLPKVVNDFEAVNGGCSTVVVWTLTFSSLMNNTLSLLVLTSAASVTISSDGLEISSLGT